MNKIIQFAIILPTIAVVIVSMLLANLGIDRYVAAVAGNPLYTPTQNSLSAVLAADSFDDPVYIVRDSIVSYRVGRTAGNPVGAVFVVSTTGWNPGLIYLVGVDSAGVISGVEIIQHDETPDFWEFVSEVQFYRQLIGNEYGMVVDVHTGATRTAYAIYSGAHAAVRYFVRYVSPTF